MRTVKLEPILSYDSPALTAIINYWEDYDQDTVIMAYAELKRRKYGFSQGLLNKLKAFSDKNMKSNIDDYTSEFLSTNQCNSFEEYIDNMEVKSEQTENNNRKGIAKKVTVSLESSEDIKNRYPALRTISGVYKVGAWIVGVLAIIIAVYFIDLAGSRGIIISLISLVIGGLIILGLLAVSEAIKVLVDIEFNTRKGALKK